MLSICINHNTYLILQSDYCYLCLTLVLDLSIKVTTLSGYSKKDDIITMEMGLFKKNHRVLNIQI